jgi:anthranilate synthase component 1
VFREVLADLDTPLTAYLKIAGQPSFLLESVEQGERVARYSFLGTGARRRFEARGDRLTVSEGGRSETLTTSDPLRVLWERTVRATRPHPLLPAFWSGVVGYASYDLVRLYERLPDANPDELGIPDLCFVEPEVVVVFDHLRRKAFIVAPAVVGDEADRARAQALVDATFQRLRGPLPGVPGDRAGQRVDFTSNFTPEAFRDAVAKAVRYIHAGDVFQVVPSQRLSADLRVHPFAVYRALRTINPSPYLGYLDLGPVTLVASSPESLVRAEGRRVETCPIAGTRKRGATAAEDAALAEELRGDAKERAEHVMLVDLGRNDLGRVCAPGTVKVTDLMSVERYSHVMHLVSRVQGELAEGRTALDALSATLPMGTASGAPKVRAMEIIDELEPVRRGPYAGAFGYLAVGGDMDMALTLRTMVVAGGRIHLQAGGGVVADSDPEFEYQESLNKLAALRRAVDVAAEGLA